MNEVSERTSTQAQMQPTSVFLQPVRVNLVSFAQQTKEANFIGKKNAFSDLFFGERECIVY